MTQPFIFFAYLLLVNLVAFALMGIDKRKAKKNKYRISEKTLFMSAIVGGSVGSLIGMYFFRHKTRHPQFQIGMPLILLIHIYILIRFLMPLFVIYMT
ncbi:DUF1294 domain-containing protein [Methanolobus sp. WCC4]|uniref:DUF1294 domain-containing protein n=1 Tax=Methanolobus sp. WCC4 TaxID=3125784 RepID=UPI0030F891E0